MSAQQSVLLIAGSPSERSRSAALLEVVGQRLAARGALIDRLLIRDLSPQALVLADVGHRSIQHAIDQAFGGWTKADKEHFADGGSFDQIYSKK